MSEEFADEAKERNKLAEALLKSNNPESLTLAKMYIEMSVEQQIKTSDMYEQFLKKNIRNLGEFSTAELAIKLAHWLISQKAF